MIAQEYISFGSFFPTFQLRLQRELDETNVKVREASEGCAKLEEAFDEKLEEERKARAESAEGLKKDLEKHEKRVAQLKEKVKKINKKGGGGDDPDDLDEEEGNE